VWRNRAGQAAVEAAVAIPLVIMLLLALVSVGYGAVAHLLVVSSAGQGARRGAALCAEQQPAAVVLNGAREAALTALLPLPGPKEAQAVIDGEDLVVSSLYRFSPPLPGVRWLAGEGLLLRHDARFHCG
jgi:hypothetical protein